MKIIYPNGDGISVIHPTGELPVEQVARKDVPPGVPFLLVADEDIPDDRTFRGAWEADFSSPHGYGIGPKAWFIEQYEAEIAALEAAAEPAFTPPPEESDESEVEALAAFEAALQQRRAQRDASIAQLRQQIIAMEAHP